MVALPYINSEGGTPPKRGEDTTRGQEKAFEAAEDGPAMERGLPQPIQTMLRIKLWAAQFRLVHLSQS